MVILEDNPAAWQATYSAYDVAARTGASLNAAVLSKINPPETMHRLERKFKTGARAAGIRSNIIEFPDLDQVLAYSDQRDALFTSRSSIAGIPELDKYLAHLPCSLWIVPNQRSIRNILIMLDGIGKASPGLNLVLSLARRWQSPLTFLGTGLSVPPDLEISDLETVLVNNPIIDQNNLLSELKARSIDLVFMSIAWQTNLIWKTIQQSDSVIAICPTI